MGAILASLFNPNGLAGFDANWDELQPNEADSELYGQIDDLLNRCQGHLVEVRNYQDQVVPIRNAMQAITGTPEGDQANREAFEALLPNATMCARWQDLSQEIAITLNTRLLPRLCEPMGAEEKSDPPSETVVFSHQALAKQLVLLLDFILAFDQAKMMKSPIQNDFSFYRRVFPKVGHEYENVYVDMDKAAQLSFFLAESTPITKDVAKNLEAGYLPVVAQLANGCLDLIRGDKFDASSPHNRNAVRAMVAAFLIYDHANPDGGFVRRSLTRGAKIAQMVGVEYEQKFPTVDRNELAGLKSLMKYGSRHFNDDSTPRSVDLALESV